jgi:molecular chaperone GrpE
MPTPEDSATTSAAEVARPEVEETEANPTPVAEDAPTADAAEAPAEVVPVADAQGEAEDAEIVEALAEQAAEEAVESAADLTDEDGSGPLGAELEMLRKQLDEAQIDIKRVAAEYKNYRDRVKRDQAAAAEVATAAVLAALLPVLDDLDRAREHGDLNGPFGSVAEQLLAVVGKFGLTAFGAKGDAFDPKLHEAVAHVPSPDVTEETCIDVMRRGYTLGDRLLRPAMVAVAAPQE